MLLQCHRYTCRCSFSEARLLHLSVLLRNGYLLFPSVPACCLRSHLLLHLLLPELHLVLPEFLFRLLLLLPVRKHLHNLPDLPESFLLLQWSLPDVPCLCRIPWRWSPVSSEWWLPGSQNPLHFLYPERLLLLQGLFSWFLHFLLCIQKDPDLPMPDTVFPDFQCIQTVLQNVASSGWNRSLWTRYAVYELLLPVWSAVLPVWSISAIRRSWLPWNLQSLCRLPEYQMLRRLHWMQNVQTGCKFRSWQRWSDTVSMLLHHSNRGFFRRLHQMYSLLLLSVTREYFLLL